MTDLQVIGAGLGIFIFLPLVCFICAKTVTLGYLKAKKDFNSKQGVK